MDDQQAFYDELKEMKQYVTSVDDVLKNRQCKQLELEDCVDTVLAKRICLSQLENPASKRSVLASITQSIHALMDSDPEGTRQNAILQTTEQIKQLEESEIRLKEELEQYGKDIETELAIYKERKISDWKALLKVYTDYHVKYHEKVSDHPVTSLPIGP